MRTTLSERSPNPTFKMPLGTAAKFLNSSLGQHKRIFSARSFFLCKSHLEVSGNAAFVPCSEYTMVESLRNGCHNL